MPPEGSRGFADPQSNPWPTWPIYNTNCYVGWGNNWDNSSSVTGLSWYGPDRHAPWSPGSRAAFWAMLDRLFPAGRTRGPRRARHAWRPAVHGARIIPGARSAIRAAAPSWARAVHRAVRDLLRT